MEVYLLWYTYVDEMLVGGEESMLIGVYSSIAEANSAIQRKLSCQGFKDNKDGFEISPYTLNEDSWSGGFIIV